MLTAIINAAASGDNQIIAAVSGRRILVLGYVLSFAGAVSAKWRDGTTDISGLLVGTTDGSITVPVAPPIAGSRQYWLATSQGNALQLSLSGAVAVSGHIVYDLGP